MPADVIDMWAPIVPVPEVMRHTVDNFPDEMLGYLRGFYKTGPTQAAFQELSGTIQTKIDDVIVTLVAGEIRRTLIPGLHERLRVAKTLLPKQIVGGLAE